MQLISDTGFWDGTTAHLHHIHSEGVSAYICEFIRSNNITTVTDFGCGLGNYCKDIEASTTAKAIGVEGSIPTHSAHTRIIQLDLAKPIRSTHELNCELGICLEVGEHVPSPYMHTLLDNIANYTEKYLIMSWAIPNQPGHGHVNCLDNDTVKELMQKRNFEYMPDETREIRSRVDASALYFKHTLLIFQKQTQ